MKTLWLILGVLIGFAVVINGDGGKPCDPVPFACFVYDWEEANNEGDIKHAFDYGTFINDHCDKTKLQPSGCDPATSPYKTPCKKKNEDIASMITRSEDGYLFKCDPTDLFCKNENDKDCFPIRTVKKYKVPKEAPPKPEETTPKPKETTPKPKETTPKPGETTPKPGETTAKPGETTAKLEETPEKPVTPPQNTDVKAKRMRRDDWDSGNLDSSNSKIITPLFDIARTITFPICHRGDTVKYCQQLKATQGRLCRGSDFPNSRDPFAAVVPWTKMSEICAVVETPLGGENPLWFANYVVGLTNEKGDKKKNDPATVETVSNIWEYTGLPYSIVTSGKTNFLSNRLRKPFSKCPLYGETNDNCEVRPICDGLEDEQKHTSYKIVHGNDGLFYANATIITGECEVACKGWDDPRVKSCRVLDMEDFPLQRQNYPPFAGFMLNGEAGFIGKPAGSWVGGADAEETNKPKRSPTSRHRRHEFHELSADGGYYYAKIGYPPPIDLNTVKDESVKALIAENYWLSSKKNPFYIKAVDLGYTMELASVVDCGPDDPRLGSPYCNGEISFSKNETGTDNKKGGLKPWILALIVIGSIFGICCCICVPVVVISIVVSMRLVQKKEDTMDKTQLEGLDDAPPPVDGPQADGAPTPTNESQADATPTNESQAGAAPTPTSESQADNKSII